MLPITTPVSERGTALTDREAKRIEERGQLPNGHNLCTHLVNNGSDGPNQIGLGRLQFNLNFLSFSATDMLPPNTLRFLLASRPSSSSSASTSAYLCIDTEDLIPFRNEHEFVGSCRNPPFQVRMCHRTEAGSLNRFPYCSLIPFHDLFRYLAIFLMMHSMYAYAFTFHPD